MKRLIALLCALVLCLAGLSAWAEEEILVEGGEGMRMMIGETPVTVAKELPVLETTATLGLLLRKLVPCADICSGVI